MSCKNDDCNGNARRGQYFCYDCHQAWKVGGLDAVQERLDALRKPAHVCVGAEQLAERDARIAELEQFKAAVVEVYTSRFAGKVLPPEPASLLTRIRGDYMTARAAGTAMRKSGAGLEYGTPLQLRTQATVLWLNNIPQRLDFRVASQDCTRTLLIEATKRNDELRRELAVALGQRCQCPKTSKHPSAHDQRLQHNQLNRIESLAKQAASGSVFWPCFLTFIATATSLGGYFLW